MSVSTVNGPPKIPAEMAALSENQTSQPSNDFDQALGHTKLGPNTTNLMKRIDGGAPTSQPRATHRTKPPRHIRDVRWLIAFLLIVPTSLFVSSCLTADPEKGYPLALSKASKRVSFFSILFVFVAAIAFARVMYRTIGGGDGDDARHFASQLLMAFAPISLGVHILMIVCIYLNTPNAMGWCIIPLWLLVRDLFAMRHWRTTASTSGGRQAFFLAICNMALDILSRSLRRASFYRAVLALLSIQFLIVLWWRSALLGALSHGSIFWFLMALLAGKWATGVVGRVLGLVASGGITAWFTEQSIIVEELERQKGSEQFDESESLVVESMVREEYRSAEASAYQAVIEMDEGIDDDFQDEDRRESHPRLWSDFSNSTVLSFLKTSLTVSFGSIAQCGLLGGLAQFVWSAIRNVEALTVTLSQRFPSTARTGFRGMPIGQEGISDGIGFTSKVIGTLHSLARSFVRSHTDLGLSQVASSYKSYQRAALDVSILMDGSGKQFTFIGFYHQEMLISLSPSRDGTNHPR